MSQHCSEPANNIYLSLKHNELILPLLLNCLVFLCCRKTCHRVALGLLLYAPQEEVLRHLCLAIKVPWYSAYLFEMIQSKVFSMLVFSWCLYWPYFSLPAHMLLWKLQLQVELLFIVDNMMIQVLLGPQNPDSEIKRELQVLHLKTASWTLLRLVINLKSCCCINCN